jgi:hypothetical protein
MLEITPTVSYFSNRVSSYYLLCLCSVSVPGGFILKLIPYLAGFHQESGLKTLHCGLLALSAAVQKVSLQSDINPL